MAAKLYLVGTPIGNLEDLSPRAVRILSEVDFIAAEDTRVTLRLCNHFGIKKPLISYYAHNLRERGEQIAARIEEGESCAVVTDAGMPCISDPGEELVALCAERGIPIETAPGPSAAVSALAVSGLPAGRFTFEGFLAQKRSARLTRLRELAAERRTMIFYEAPHRLLSTLEDMLEVLGDRRAAVVKELTKIHESVLRAPLSQAAAYFRETPPRGEYVVVLEGAPEAERARPPLEEAVRQVRARAESGEPLSQAARAVAAETGYRKNELYALASR
ncbi:MAG: 16S rRNA (cytidine(1402)-2'-O)-methyltransferase [Provencibacterium sp.]|jgi:16S rRNA (cytidine1402-2'-O)-methyltransferase|nr:16S rRNA (cytidine(1402)-2'-O)-methyltransferase [Provencibacterium sp.]